MNNEIFLKKLKEIEDLENSRKNPEAFMALLAIIPSLSFTFLLFFTLIQYISIGDYLYSLKIVVLPLLTLLCFFGSLYLILYTINKELRLTLQIDKHIYTGSLKDVFDFSVPEINEVLKDMEKEIEGLIIKNKGLSGHDILRIKEKIKPFVDKRVEELAMREKLARQEEIKNKLMEAQTVSGKMLKDFQDSIKS